MTEPGLPAATIEIHTNMPESYRRGVAELAELLENETTRPKAMEAIRRLIDWMKVGPPGTARGPCSVTLVGALASVLIFVTERSATRNRRALTGHGGSNLDTRLFIARTTW